MPWWWWVMITYFFNDGSVFWVNNITVISGEVCYLNFFNVSEKASMAVYLVGWVVDILFGITAVLWCVPLTQWKPVKWFEQQASISASTLADNPGQIVLDDVLHGCPTYGPRIRPAGHNPTHPAFLSGPQTLLILSKLIDSFHCNIDYQVFGGQQPKNTRTAFDDDFCHSHFLQKVIQNIAKNFSFSRRCWPRTVVDTGLFARLCLFTFGLGHRHRPSGPACMPVCQASPSHTHTHTRSFNGPFSGTKLVPER